MFYYNALAKCGRVGSFVLMVLLSSTVSGTQGDGLGCDRTVRAFGNLNLPVLDIPHEDIPGESKGKKATLWSVSKQIPM